MKAPKKPAPSYKMNADIKNSKSEFAKRTEKMTSKWILWAVIALIIAAIDGASVTSCNENEVYLPAGQAPNCDTECSTLGEPCYTNHFVAPSGCYCIENYARDDDRVCIPIKNCKAKV